jgi:F-box interacting protein
VADMGSPTRAPERRRSILIDLPEEILWEILLLLPPKYILRCRAVCKALRHVASDHAFLLAHHRRQPLRRLLSFVRDVGNWPNNLDLVDYCVEALDLRSHEFRSVVRFTAGDYDSFEEDSPLAIHAACNGLLLMSFKRRLYLCNPTTRQWVSILRPTLKHDIIMGLYAHGSSSEYRVLYCRRNHGKPLFFISTVDSEIERCICPSLSSVSMRKWLGRRSEADHLNEPFLISGNLHWLPCLGQQGKILVFDTLNEIFWWLRVPFKIRLVVSFLEVEGSLAMSNSHMGSSKVDVWLLLDYKCAEWVHKFRIEVPVLDIRRFEDYEWCSHVLSGEGDIFVDGREWLLHYDTKGNLLKKFQCNGRMLSIPTHILRESLVSHAFFRTQENGDMRAPPFFQGL